MTTENATLAKSATILFPAFIFVFILASACLKSRQNKAKRARDEHETKSEIAQAERRPSQAIIEKQVLNIKRRTKMMDRIVFTGSVMNLGLTTYFMGHWPQHFWIWHTMNSIVLISIRFVVFRLENQHYFLYDFCYWANYYSLIYVLMNPTNPRMFQVLFMVSNGPLAWSIPLFNNSTVFHNLQHMTSVFIHFSPMALTLCVRWAKSDRFAICDQDQDDPNCAQVSSFQMIYDALTRLYLWWMVLYYLWVFILLDQRVKRKGYMTLFSWLLTLKLFGDLLTSLSPYEVVQKAAYVLGHYVFALLTMVFATILWHNFYIHLTFVVAICTFAAWNGAGYYLSVFSTRYEKEVEKKAQSALEKRSQSAAPSRRSSRAEKISGDGQELAKEAEHSFSAKRPKVLQEEDFLKSLNDLHFHFDIRKRLPRRSSF